jgi:hypothetical protein
MRIAQTAVAVAGLEVLALGILSALRLEVRLQATGPSPESPQTIVVSTSAELEGALSPSNAGRYITVRAGTYELTHGLVVPDGATVAGEGAMMFDESGWPQGF